MERQPPRGEDEGTVRLWRDDNDCMHVECVHAGKTTEVVMGPFNVWRVFGTLALMLGVSLPGRVANSIKLSDGKD